MGAAAVWKAFEDVRAALAVLHAEVDGAGLEPFSVGDPLAGLADGCLDVLGGVREVEAGFAALKAKAAVAYAESADAVAGPDAPVQAQEMAVAAEIGCVLALGPRAAGSFLAASDAVVASLPLTLAGLQEGVLSWAHAVAMVEETAGLDAAGAAALEAHFLDPDVPDPARGCPIGEMPAHRFRVKARTWRERHYPEGIERRHAKSLQDRRVLVDPRDGAPLEIGRTSYRLTKAMRNWLMLRDAKCPFPGCSNNSLDNDADHILAWANGGTTGISNLGQPCRKHHRLRHTTGWTPTPASKDEPPGWTSPTGRHYTSEHQDWEPPRWPPELFRGTRSLLDEALLECLAL